MYKRTSIVATIQRWLLGISLSVAFQAANEARTCNGYAEYCDKKISQVLWMGAHDAFSEANISTGYINAMPLPVVQRNQFVAAPALLDAGIRYFHVNTCAYASIGSSTRQSPIVCHNAIKTIVQLYQPLETPLSQIKAWLDAHPTEVIYLNFINFHDFMVLSPDGMSGTETEALMDDVATVIRRVFGSMAILKGESEVDDRVSADSVTLGELISSNQRVIVEIGTSSRYSHNDRICNNAYYEDALPPSSNTWTTENWSPMVDFVIQRMELPCSAQPRLLNKLEWQYRTATGQIIHGDGVGLALAQYISSLEAKNVPQGKSPYFPFNMVLTDHSDKWTSYYDQWHRTHLGLPRLAAMQPEATKTTKLMDNHAAFSYASMNLTILLMMVVAIYISG